MIEFEHLITQSEVNSEYINLTSTDRRQYGSRMGVHDTVLTVIDGHGRRFKMKRHHGNQLTRCSEWFTTNAIKPRTMIIVRFDPFQSTLHLLPATEAQPVQSQPLGSVSFARDGRSYEVRCVVEGGKVRVRGLLNGKQAGAFDF